jgi:hypothetical protein
MVALEEPLNTGSISRRSVEGISALEVKLAQEPLTTVTVGEIKHDENPPNAVVINDEADLARLVARYPKPKMMEPLADSLYVIRIQRTGARSLIRQLTQRWLWPGQK